MHAEQLTQFGPDFELRMGHHLGLIPQSTEASK